MGNGVKGKGGFWLPGMESRKPPESYINKDIIGRYNSGLEDLCKGSNQGVLARTGKRMF